MIDELESQLRHRWMQRKYMEHRKKKKTDKQAKRVRKTQPAESLEDVVSYEKLKEDREAEREGYLFSY